MREAEDHHHVLVAGVGDGAGIDPRGQPGTGLSNLRERLAGFFGGAATLQLEERQPRGVCARIVITGGSDAP